MLWGALLSLVAVAPSAHALLRFACSQLVTQRFDPLVTPGIVSPHVHQIVGGNAFDVAMDPSIDYAKAATCTTCKFKEDASNYWTAVLYFKNPNGSYIRVPQMANQFTGSPNGGMTVYYIQPSNNQRVTSFPKGFRMIVGNPMVRNNTHRDANSAEARAITWRCFGANFASDNAYPHPGTGPLDTIELPKRACAGGIRSNVFFPSCWNGKDLDPADHASHVAWPTGTIPRDGHFFMGGSCPASHPVRLPLLFLEIVWDTRQFNNMWPTDGSQPFVLSQGDPTGFGQHADYVFGWDGDSLQRAMDRCTDLGGNPSGCRELTLVSDADMNRCTQQPRVDEVVEGRYLNAMPGCNPVQNGPNEATMINNCNAVSTYIGQPAAPTQTSAPTVTAAPPVPTTTTVVNPQPTAPAGPAVPKYGQCGGVGWTGSTACTAGTTCQKMNDWYSQCL
ncbi:hypothetical protein FA13DRAFT_1754676 [Coprinellus micaceus]|uniref:CBM1 domain-containing protein n=1 Tax=Coprinellus micaceus TaxID=71717 RepID=A0A4Y7TE92_COPMI|nr:hypothetical protein FA13DRAFT_1754676 [Coprinellus micaceus]